MRVDAGKSRQTLTHRVRRSTGFWGSCDGFVARPRLFMDSCRCVSRLGYSHEQAYLRVWDDELVELQYRPEEPRLADGRAGCKTVLVCDAKRQAWPSRAVLGGRHTVLPLNEGLVRAAVPANDQGCGKPAGHVGPELAGAAGRRICWRRSRRMGPSAMSALTAPMAPRDVITARAVWAIIPHAKMPERGRGISRRKSGAQ